jgi:S-formylglutathione hydrolase
MTSAPFETISKHRCFGGTVGFYKHQSTVNACTMKFSVFTPPQAERGKVPVLYYLAGLTCTEETFMTKAGAQRRASELGLMLVAPDTSPRGVPLPGDSESYDFGVGAGFYVDATQAPWSKHYKMFSYVTQELPSIIDGHFPGDPARQGIFGHSMGGHGALTIGLKNPGNRYRSISAFAPIAAPRQVPWGIKAFTNYLGGDREAWSRYDATELVKSVSGAEKRSAILIDQGLADQFLETQLHPHLFEEACRDVGQALTLRRQPGYDHGYYFIQSFVDEHLRHHARILG